MMNNMFSMFDPSTFFLGTGWLILMMLLLLVPISTSKNKENMNTSSKLILMKVEKEISQLMGMYNKKMSSTKMIKMFFLFMAVNMLALLPFNFTPTAHISMSFTILLALWATSMMNSLVNNTKKTMIHMTPMGTPTPLMNFMVIIELVSNTIRPITLAVRLSANMVAGHLLISLLSNFSLMTYKNMLLSIPTMMALSILELMVAIIQAYVIITLVSLYHNESM